MEEKSHKLTIVPATRLHQFYETKINLQLYRIFKSQKVSCSTIEWYVLFLDVIFGQDLITILLRKRL